MTRNIIRCLVSDLMDDACCANSRSNVSQCDDNVGQIPTLTYPRLPLAISNKLSVKCKTTGGGACGVLMEFLLPVPVSRAKLPLTT
jgi:hypothetical protein